MASVASFVFVGQIKAMGQLRAKSTGNDDDDDDDNDNERGQMSFDWCGA